MPKYRSIFDAPPEVINRYYRRKWTRKYWPPVEAATRRYSRVTLTFRERKKNKVLKATLETFKREAERANSKGNECTQALMNMGLFYLLAENDIQAVKIDALTHPDEWKRKLSLRTLKKAQRKAAKILHQPRNSVIAHRDANALAQVETIESLNAKEVFGAAEDFYASSDRFMGAFSKVLLQAGSLHGLVAFMLNKKKA